jgi:hypothetical protein
MLVFYSEAQGRPNVPAESPKDESLENVLTIFRSLDTRRGFMGIPLQSPFVLQLLPTKKGVRIELLDSSRPAVDACDADRDFAEGLLKAASEGLDVCQFARRAVSEWDHTDLG